MRYGATHGHPLKIREKLCSIIRTLQGSGKGLMWGYFSEKNKTGLKDTRYLESYCIFSLAGRYGPS
jgi:hypothetical protein